MTSQRKKLGLLQDRALTPGLSLRLQRVWVGVAVMGWVGLAVGGAFYGGKRTPAKVTPLQIEWTLATPEDLELLPGVGPTLAARLYEVGLQKGFGGQHALLEVPRLGPAVQAQVAPWLVFETPAPQVASAGVGRERLLHR